MTETIREKLRAGLQREWDMALCSTAPFNAAQWADAILNILSEPGEEDVERVARALNDEDPLPMGMFHDEERRALARAAIKSYVSGGEG